MANPGRVEVAAPCIALDLGGTRLRAALLEGPRVLQRAAVATPTGGAAAMVARLEALIAEVCAGIDPGSTLGIALASAGPLDTEAGVILGIPTIPGLEGLPIVSVLSERTGRPVFLEGDAIAAAFGEWRYGAGRGLRHMAYLTISTGIGGGIISDGRPMRGRKGMAGHVGHIRLSEDGPRCSCGASGCFEALASGTAFEARARQVLDEDIGAAQVFDRARGGDPHCLALVDEVAGLIGRGVTSVIHLCSPERVVIGGGMSGGFDLLDGGIHKVIRSEALVPFREVGVVPASLGDNAGLIGVAALMSEQGGP